MHRLSKSRFTPETMYHQSATKCQTGRYRGSDGIARAKQRMSSVACKTAIGYMLVVNLSDKSGEEQKKSIMARKTTQRLLYVCDENNVICFDDDLPCIGLPEAY